MTIKDFTTMVGTLMIGMSCFVLLASCGKSSGTSSNKNAGKQTEEILTVDGIYEAKLAPLNSSVSGFTWGQVRVHLIADHLSVQVDVKDAPASTVHAQYIYEASECPSEADDTNNDGFVDPTEASKVLGKALIPLDGELNSQDEAIEKFPMANGLGNYSYYKEATFSLLLADLMSPDLNPEDEVMKLNPGQSLKLDGKVIVIQGISDDTYLPGSIRSLGAGSERRTLNVACGKLERIRIEDEEMGNGDSETTGL